MSRKLITLNVLRQVVAEYPRVFSTKDISEDDRLRRSHEGLASHTHFHAFVGGALSDHHIELGIVEIRKGTSRGSRWEKQGIVPQAISSAVESRSENVEPLYDIGPQCCTDSPFAARMRWHQSWYRANVLRVPFGTGPRPTSTSHYGNMLKRNDAEAGRNFLTDEITEVARKRVAQNVGTVEPFRLFHNMLSSQPMCFNLFGPLVNDPAPAKMLLSSILPGNVAEVLRVAIEWAPEPATAYLGDRTAFDAFIEYRDTTGQLNAVGIETKLAEPFSLKEYDGERYRRWMRVLDSPWRHDVDNKVHHIAHNQLWRDHLLTVALRHQQNSPYAKTYLMLVRHPQDTDCNDCVKRYQTLLRDGDESLIDMPLDHLCDAWSSVINDDRNSRWIQAFRLRYLDLQPSKLEPIPDQLLK